MALNHEEGNRSVPDPEGHRHPVQVDASEGLKNAIRTDLGLWPQTKKNALTQESSFSVVQIMQEASTDQSNWQDAKHQVVLEEA